MRDQFAEYQRIAAQLYIDEVRELVNRFNLNEISISKMTELLNQKIHI